MAMAGNTFADLVRNVWTPGLQTTVFRNFWLFDSSRFPVVKAPPGAVISSGYEYAIQSNAGTYNFDDPMVESFTSQQVKAFFNKDPYQEAARTFNVYKDYMAGGGEPGDFDTEKHSIETAAGNLRNKVVTSMILDLESQIDAAAAYSDANLDRAVYLTLKSYEEDTPGALTLTHLDDLVEALLTHGDYGQNIESETDLLFMVPMNQKGRIARLAGPEQYKEFVVNSQNSGPVDMGALFRTQAFNGIEIVSVPGMTTTTLLCVHKPDVAVYETRPLTITPKTEAADTELALLTCNYNTICKRPGNSAKLSAKTA